jgi:hypothetical protein
LWACSCDCGKSHSTSAHDLRRGLVRSCGCVQRCKHGYARDGKKHPLYNTWSTMHDRCRRPNHPKYKYYGALGVTVCARWNDFAVFLADVGERPHPSLTLDRYPDPDGNYEPGNVRWATHKQQRANRRS